MDFFYLMIIIEGDLILFFFMNMGHFFKEVKNNFSDSIDAFSIKVTFSFSLIPLEISFETN